MLSAPRRSERLAGRRASGAAGRRSRPGRADRQRAGPRRLRAVAARLRDRPRHHDAAARDGPTAAPRRRSARRCRGWRRRHDRQPVQGQPLRRAAVRQDGHAVARARASGYITSASGNEFVFSVIANNFLAPNREIDAVVEGALGAGLRVVGSRTAAGRSEPLSAVRTSAIQRRADRDRPYLDQDASALDGHRRRRPPGRGRGGRRPCRRGRHRSAGRARLHRRRCGRHCGRRPARVVRDRRSAPRRGRPPTTSCDAATRTPCASASGSCATSSPDASTPRGQRAACSTVSRSNASAARRCSCFRSSRSLHERIRHVGRRHRQRRAPRRRPVAQRAIALERAPPAQERDAGAAAEALGAANHDQRRLLRCVPTCVPPQADRSWSGDVDQPHAALAGRRLAQARLVGEIGCVGVADRHRPVVPHDPVGVVLGAAALVSRHFPMQVERARLEPEMDALGPRLEQVIERGRQDVLPRVLLAEVLSP